MTPSRGTYVYNPIGRDRTEQEKIFSLVPGKYSGMISWLAMDGTDDEQTDGQGALEAIRLLDSFEEEDYGKPFFLAFGLYRPHTPFVAPTKYFDLYPPETIAVPPIQLPREPAEAFRSAKPEERAMTDRQRQEAIQAYYAATTFMDAQVGRVLDALERLELAQNTIVVFTSDHGYHLGEHGLWKKRSLFEESARVPLIISVPGMYSPGRHTARPVELLDLYPTLAALCGLPIPEHVMGRNLSSLLTTADDPTGGVALTQEIHSYRVNDERIRYKGYTIRTERYRYTEWDEGRRGIELYDHTLDPREMHNLAQDEDYAEALAEMKTHLESKLRTIREKDLSALR